MEDMMINDRFIKPVFLLLACAVVLTTAGCGNSLPDVTFSVLRGNNRSKKAIHKAKEDAQDSKEESASSEEETTEETKYKNLIPGGDFRSQNSSWGLYTESGGRASISVSEGKLICDIADPGTKEHSVQVYCDGFDLRENGKYHFEAHISSDVPRTYEWRIQQNGGDYHPYVRIEEADTGPDGNVIKVDFSMENVSDPAPRLCFNLGDADKAQSLGAHKVYIDDVALYLTNETESKEAKITGELFDINADQIGYRTNDEKRAVVRNCTAGDAFCVKDENGNEVFKGKLTEGITYGSSGDKVCYADFSELKTPGTYTIETEGKTSFAINIRDNVYDNALYDSLRMLYLQRCGIELTKKEAGDFAHRACHTDRARLYGGGGTLDVSGGWHDAGDYGRYTVPAAKTVADLLLSYELFPDAFKGENGYDILGEAKYELDWLLKMQSPDGGVYHKVTGLEFDGFIKADECTEELYVLPVSKTATADFAGVMYMAARVYAKSDPTYAQKCKDAADHAIESYKTQINDRNFTNPPDVNTGEYADNSSADEFLWAICEGYKTTGEDRFADMTDLLETSRIGNGDLGWEDMEGYGFYAYLTSDDPFDIGLDIRTIFYKWVDGLKDLALTGEAYGSTIKDDYPWGSNMTIADNGMALLMAYGLTGNEDYYVAAHRQLDYLFGTNCTSYCFLTGFGVQSPEHPHHRPSQAAGTCMKGMLVGGPDSGLHDPYAKKVLAGLPKARCYVDSDQSYSTNEVTIYWNSPLVFLIAGLKDHE